MEAQTLLNKGKVCTMGSGGNLIILNDLWLPCADDPYAHTWHEALNNRMVQSLMVTGEDIWVVDLVKNIFRGKWCKLDTFDPYTH